MPLENSAEFFGFYNIFGKFAAITGPLLMAVVTALSGQSRWGMLSIMVLFIAGALLLSRVEESPRQSASDSAQTREKKNPIGI